MITVNNKEYRNLVEQVGYLTNRVDEHYERDRVLEDYGIRVVGSVNSVDQLPNPVAYDGLYGDAYTVGTGAPYDFYIFTRPLQGETENRWLDLGQLAIQGPQGDIGPEGPVGPQGESTQWYVGQGVPYLEANVNSLYFDTTTANIYQKQEGQWVMVANIKGNTGAQGPQGPQGERGEQGPQGIQGENGVPGDAVNIVGILTSSSMLPDPDTVARDSAYVIEDGTGQWLYFITGLGTTESPLIWDRVAFENGTTVLVNGNPVQTFDADSKVDALTAGKEFAVVPFYAAGSTVQGWKSIGVSRYSAVAANLVQYLSVNNVEGDYIPTGTIIVNTPTKIAHAANKKYVDEQVQAAKDASVAKITTAKRIYGTSSDGTTTTGYILNGESAEAGSIPQRRSGGRIVTGTPTVDADATNKKYVDDAIAAKPHITEQFKFMNPEDSSTNKLALSTYYAMDNTHITFEAIPLDVNLASAGIAFSTTPNVVYRKLEFFKSSDVLQSNAPWCRGTLVDGTVSYFQPASSGGTLVARSGPILVTVTISPITAL